MRESALARWRAVLAFWRDRVMRALHTWMHNTEHHNLDNQRFASAKTAAGLAQGLRRQASMKILRNCVWRANVVWKLPQTVQNWVYNSSFHAAAAKHVITLSMWIQV